MHQQSSCEIPLSCSVQQSNPDPCLFALIFLLCTLILLLRLRPLQLEDLTLVAMGIWVRVDGGSFLQLLGPFSWEGAQSVNVDFFCMATGSLTQ